MKKVFYFIGAGLAIGAVAAIAVYLLNSKKKKECESSHGYKIPGEERTSVGKEDLTEVNIAQDEPVFEEAKSFAIGSMHSRHEEAATIMRDSVKTIRENVKSSEDTNEEIDAVSAELDKMLSED